MFPKMSPIIPVRRAGISLRAPTGHELKYDGFRSPTSMRLGVAKQSRCDTNFPFVILFRPSIDCLPIRSRIYGVSRRHIQRHLAFLPLLLEVADQVVQRTSVGQAAEAAQNMRRMSENDFHGRAHPSRITFTISTSDKTLSSFTARFDDSCVLSTISRIEASRLNL